MIFVTLGTQKQQFTRLLEMLENSVELKNEKVIVQAGHTKFKSNFLEIYDFLEIEKMREYIKEAEYVICHGGVGSIIDSLNLGKKVIALPRLQKYVEHVDNHQIEICEKLKKEGYIEYILEDENIDDVIKRLKEKDYKKYVPDNFYLEKIENVIKELVE